jgi:hypothetical protein
MTVTPFEGSEEGPFPSLGKELKDGKIKQSRIYENQKY